jgi:hypothetical protein
MTQQFSWYTEDQDPRGSDEVPSPPQERQPKPAHRMRVLATIALLLIGVSWALLRQIGQRVDAAADTLAGEVGSSFAVLARAVTQKDAELLDTILSGQDRAWIDVQQDLLAEGLHFDRYPVGIEAETVIPEVVAIIPSPDLKEAEITVAGQYRSIGMRSATLQQSLRFQRDQTGWRLSPHRNEFWGAWETAQGRFVTAIFRERDSAVGHRLAKDLDAQVDAVCTELADMKCPEDLSVSIRLAPEPASMLAVMDDRRDWSSRTRLNLPTPSLIGLPVDEDGYQLLLRSYARPIVAAAVSKAASWECCDGALFYQALLDHQLAQLGLQAWPMTADEYETMFMNPVVEVRDLERYWAAPPSSDVAWRQVYSFVAYLLSSRPSLSAAAMQSRLSGADGFEDWMRRLLPELAFSAVYRDWLAYARGHLAQPKLPLPAQDVLLLCDSELVDATSLYRFDLSNGKWQVEVDDAYFMSVSAAGDRDGSFLLDRLMQIRRIRATIWRAGNVGQLFTRPLASGLFLVDAAGDRFLIFAHDYLEQFASGTQWQATECQAGHCETAVVTGLPKWSPDGRRTLMIGQDGTIWLGDSRGVVLRQMAIGSAPFWLDNNRYGYLRPDIDPAQPGVEVAVADVVSGDTQTWFRPDALAEAESADLRFGHLTINAARASSANPGLLFVAASAADRVPSDTAYVFVLNQDTNETELLTETDYGIDRYSSFTLSPDRRWLTLNSFDNRSSDWQLHLYDSFTGRGQTLSSAYPFTINGHAWSANGQWLLRVQDGFLHMLAPGEGDQLIINHEFSNCSFATWTD